jgi:hypothetical protein
MSVVSTRTSSCVDCAASIIGERFRCPPCHQLHATSPVASLLDDEDATAPRPRHDEILRDELVPGFLVRGLVAIEVLAIVVLSMIFVLRSCR